MPAEPHWPHASLVMKIVQGGMEGNQKMVVAYTELLIQKLRRDGVTRQADLMQQSLDVHLGLREPVLVRSMADTPGGATAPQCPKGCGLMGTFFDGWRCNHCGETASEYLAKIEADPRRAAALQRARDRAAGVEGTKNG